MFCPSCGHQATNKEQFCIQCGTKLPNESVATQASADEQNQHQQKTDFSPSLIQGVLEEGTDSAETVISKKFYIGILVATVILPIIGIIMGIIYMLKDHPEQNKAGKMWLIVGVAVAVLNGILLSASN